jgi:hypothetical protein
VGASEDHEALTSAVPVQNGFQSPPANDHPQQNCISSIPNAIQSSRIQDTVSLYPPFVQTVRVEIILITGQRIPSFASITNVKSHVLYARSSWEARRDGTLPKTHRRGGW